MEPWVVGVALAAVVLAIVSLRVIKDSERFATRLPGGSYRICGPGIVLKWPLVNRGWIRLAPGDAGRTSRPGRVTVNGVELAVAGDLPVGLNVRVTGFDGHGRQSVARVERV